MGGVFDAASARGLARFDQLTSRRSFSFGEYRDAQRMGFGALRVLNEDILAPGAGVPLHSHENMEILSLPLAGTLRHQDSRGASHLIAPGEVHLLSAGLGVTHWEFNHSTTKPAHYLQLWIQPRSHRTPTHYGQGRIAGTEARFLVLAAPAGDNGIVTLNQDAWVSLATLPAAAALDYAKHRESHGVYLFVIDGRVQAGSAQLQRGDALGLRDDAVPPLRALEAAALLAIEVPLETGRHAG